MPRKNNARRRPRRKATKARAQKSSGEVNISRCGRDYAYALVSPFRAYEQGIAQVCVPDSIVVPTAKKVYRLRGTMMVANSAAKLGFVSLAPFAPTNANTGAHVSWSSAGTDLTMTKELGVAVQIYNTPFPNCAYTAANYTDGYVATRTVAAAVRVRYAGTNLNRGGRMASLANPSGETLMDLTPGDIFGHPASRSHPVTGNWTTVTWAPRRAKDGSFIDAIDATEPIGIVVEAATSGELFEWEAILFTEEVGSLAGAGSMSHSDPIAYGAAQTLANTAMNSRKDAWSVGQVVDRLANYVRDSTTWVSAHSDSLRVLHGAAQAAYGVASAQRAIRY